MMTMMRKEMGTVLIGECGIGLHLGEVVGDLQVRMEELRRGPALIMVVLPVPTPSLNKEAVQIMAELKVLLMRGIAG